MKMLYVGGSYSPLDNLKVSALYANSKAESPGYVGYTTGATPGTTRNFASDHGSEYDLTIDWDIYDNLNYTFIAAFLDVGDYWQFGTLIVNWKTPGASGNSCSSPSRIHLERGP